MSVIPPVVHRARAPSAMSQVETSKPEKGGGKDKGKQSAQPDPEPECELDEEGGG